jgi:Tol biopolymer transport system component
MKSIQSILVLETLLVSMMTTSCNLIHAYTRYPGIAYVAAVGSPPADTLRWSPRDPTQILVNSNGIGYGAAQVSVLDIGTSRRTVLAETEYGDIWGSSWSPDGNFVALAVDGATKGYPRSGIWIVNARDRSLGFFTDRFGDAVWMPDGRSLGVLAVDLASGQNPRRVSFSLVDIQNKTERQVYANEDAVTFLGASPSPDGRSVVLSLQMRQGGTSDLYILDLQTGMALEISHNGSSTFPSWSPDGNLIAYDRDYPSEGSPRSSLHLIRPDGSCDMELPSLSYAVSPTWSPDGSTLAFIGPDGIYTMDLAKFLGRDVTHALRAEN